MHTICSFIYTVVFCGRVHTTLIVAYGVHTTLIVAYGVQSTLLHIFGGYSTPQIKDTQIRHVVIRTEWKHIPVQHSSHKPT